VSDDIQPVAGKHPDPRLAHLPGVPAEIFVEPSREQWFWARKASWLFAPTPGKESFLARWYAIITVVPSTNVTNLSLQYQSYMNDIFHTTKCARIGHTLAMPCIVVCWLMIARLLGESFAMAFHTGMTLWWLAWAFIERDILWGAALLALSAAIWLASAAASAHGISPWLPLLAFAAIQTLSHALEPVPPRVSRSPFWVPVTDYLLSGSWGQRLRNLSRTCIQVLFGMIDEILASPRLVCVVALEILWAFGHRPRQRTAWKALSRKAIASGNPALDYIGIGGATPLNPCADTNTNNP
jgi:hypothetical protein